MQAPGSGPRSSIRKSGNVNFDGPKGCYERNERCGRFQVSVDSEKANPRLDLKKYVDGDMQGRTVISTELRKLDGLPAYFIILPEDQRLVVVKYKGFVFRISYGPNDHKPTDKALEEIFVRMMSSFKFNK